MTEQGSARHPDLIKSNLKKKKKCIIRLDLLHPIAFRSTHEAASQNTNLRLIAFSQNINLKNRLYFRSMHIKSVHLKMTKKSRFRLFSPYIQAIVSIFSILLILSIFFQFFRLFSILSIFQFCRFCQSLSIFSILPNFADFAKFFNFSYFVPFVQFCPFLLFIIFHYIGHLILTVRVPSPPKCSSSTGVRSHIFKKTKEAFYNNRP